jgi:flagellar basal-body rod protein FlgC
MNPMEISRTGLDVEWRRLELIAQNLANANSSAGPGGEVYRPLSLLTGPRTAFSSYLDGSGRPAGVEIRAVVASGATPRRVHEPGHPQADAEGYVTYPALDHSGEMVRMVSTARAYEANLVAMGIAREMYSKAIELGRRS